jgi:hypothetical protein
MPLVYVCFDARKSIGGDFSPLRIADLIAFGSLNASYNKLLDNFPSRSQGQKKGVKCDIGGYCICMLSLMHDNDGNLYLHPRNHMNNKPYCQTCAHFASPVPSRSPHYRVLRALPLSRGL